MPTPTLTEVEIRRTDGSLHTYIRTYIYSWEKCDKAGGPDCLPIEVAKALGDEGVVWMTGVLNEAMREKIPAEWRTSIMTHIYKQKGDPLECNKFRGIKLLSHTLKLSERVVESRLRKMVNIIERQYGFRPGRSTIQPLFCLRMLQEKHK